MARSLERLASVAALTLFPACSDLSPKFPDTAFGVLARNAIDYCGSSDVQFSSEGMDLPKKMFFLGDDVDDACLSLAVGIDFGSTGVDTWNESTGTCVNWELSDTQPYEIRFGETMCDDNGPYRRNTTRDLLEFRPK